MDSNLPGFVDFVHCLNSQFTAHTRHGPVELTLVDAREQERGQRPLEFRTPISLVFSSDSNIILTQDNYRLDHPRLGTARYLLVPIASGKPIPNYQVMLA